MNGKTGDKIERRYPMSFALRYVMAMPTPGRTGAGETVWLSRTEVAFLSKGPAAVGDKVVVHIDWPVLLEGEVPLQLTALAEIVQRSGPLSIARLGKHEFRTRGAQAARKPAPATLYRAGATPWSQPRRTSPPSAAAASASGA